MPCMNAGRPERTPFEYAPGPAAVRSSKGLAERQARLVVCPRAVKPHGGTDAASTLSLTEASRGSESTITRIATASFQMG